METQQTWHSGSTKMLVVVSFFCVLLGGFVGFRLGKETVPAQKPASSTNTNIINWGEFKSTTVGVSVSLSSYTEAQNKEIFDLQQAFNIQTGKQPGTSQQVQDLLSDASTQQTSGLISLSNLQTGLKFYNQLYSMHFTTLGN